MNSLSTTLNEAYGFCYYWMYLLLLIIGAVSPEKLIRYAHKISQASTAVSPVGWQPSELYCMLLLVYVRHITQYVKTKIEYNVELCSEDRINVIIANYSWSLRSFN